MLTERKKQLLNTIIRRHIKEAQPVGSSVIAEMKHFDVSPATIRNEMMALEKEGYLYQPHTSAGRLPTEKAWRYYLDNKVAEKVKLAPSSEKQLSQALKRGENKNQAIKEMSKELAEISKLTIFFSFTPNDNFYTGIANLFHHPEFSEQEIIYEVSSLIDHLDEVVSKLFPRVASQACILIGKDNPFGVHCGLTVIKGKQGMLGMLGPIRQDYHYNCALLDYSQVLVTNL
ncbi:MAG: hypothetical protein V1838_02720 [Patescibacteria group bacterium]